jgi:DNA polymerase III delta subunit
MAELLNAYALVGTDDAAIAALRARLSGRVTAEGGTVTSVNAAKSKATDVLGMLAQPQLGGGVLLVIVTNAGAWKKAAIAAVVDYLRAPFADTVLCLCAEKLDARLTAPIKAASGLVTRNLPTAAGRETWIAAVAATAGVTLDPGAVRALAELDPESHELTAELSKLAVWADGETVTAADVAVLAEFSAADATPWAFLDAVGQRRSRPALSELSLLFADGAQPAQLVGLLKGRVRRLAQAKVLIEHGASTVQVAKATDQKTYAAGKLVLQAKRWTLARLIQASRRLEESEALIFASLDPQIRQFHLERTVAAITQSPRTVKSSSGTG